MEEIWLPTNNIIGYEVSNLGRVRSIDKKVRGSNQYGTSFKCVKKGKILKPRLKNGYETVHLSNDGKCKDYLVHILVAMAFIPNPNNFPQVNHKDENKANNNVNNLEWCTRSYNCSYGTRCKRIWEKRRRVK